MGGQYVIGSNQEYYFLRNNLTSRREKIISSCYKLLIMWNKNEGKLLDPRPETSNIPVPLQLCGRLTPELQWLAATVQTPAHMSGEYGPKRKEESVKLIEINPFVLPAELLSTASSRAETICCSGFHNCLTFPVSAWACRRSSLSSPSGPWTLLSFIPQSVFWAPGKSFSAALLITK